MAIYPARCDFPKPALAHFDPLIGLHAILTRLGPAAVIPRERDRPTIFGSDVSSCDHKRSYFGRPPPLCSGGGGFRFGMRSARGKFEMRQRSHELATGLKIRETEPDSGVGKVKAGTPLGICSIAMAGGSPLILRLVEHNGPP